MTEVNKSKKIAKKKEGAALLRVGACILWLLAVACEVLAVLVLVEKAELPLPWSPVVKMIIFLVMDLVFLFIGSQLWKNANHKAPVSHKDKVRFWIYNNMGVLVSVFAFIPFVITALSNKYAEKKTKVISIIAAAVMLAVLACSGYNFRPLTDTQLETAKTVLDGQTVFWSNRGHRYHLNQDCPALSTTADQFGGTVSEAVQNYDKDFLCKYCMKRNVNTVQGLEALVYGGKN